MSDYRVRLATPADIEILVSHRIGMFTDMGVEMNRATFAPTFRRWLEDAVPSGVYRAWVVELVDPSAFPHVTPRIVGGGGIIVTPWPPGPRYPGDRLAVVFNLYVEPAHRRRGLARTVMDTIHSWCRQSGVTSLALNASVDGRSLYEAMGYRESPNPMMFFSLE